MRPCDAAGSPEKVAASPDRAERSRGCGLWRWRWRPSGFASQRVNTNFKLRPSLFHWLSRWRGPVAFDDLPAGQVAADQIVPAILNRQVVACRWVAAEVDGRGAVGIGLRGHAVEGIGVEMIGREEALFVVDGDRPERLHRHVLRHGERVGGLAVVLLGRGGEVHRPL